MNIYLDDDHDADILIGLLQQAGHNVISPRSVGTSGLSDKRHMSYSADNDYILLTGNARDFIGLSQKWLAAGKHHPGILIVYKENNPKRDMTPQQIARAVSNIEQSGLPLANACHNLNFWR